MVSCRAVFRGGAARGGGFAARTYEGLGSRGRETCGVSEASYEVLHPTNVGYIGLQPANGNPNCVQGSQKLLSVLLL